MKRHEVLLNSDGSLKHSAKTIPKVREYIQSLPKTSVTFSPSSKSAISGSSRNGEFDDFHIPNIETPQVEFAGAWRVPDYYDLAEGNGRIFVNPYAYHANTYPGIIVQCQCGANFSVAYDDDRGNIRNEHNHEESCRPWYRLEARAEMARRRIEELERLGEMGWQSNTVGPYLGRNKDGVGQLAQRNNTSMTEIRDAYRRKAGNTYAYLVREEGHSSELVAEIYDHDRSTLGRWSYQYGDYQKLKSGGQPAAADD